MEVPKLLGQLRGSPQAQRPDLRGASDVHCGKSQARRHELQLLAGGKERLSNRDRLCLDIDERLPQQAKTESSAYGRNLFVWAFLIRKELLAQEVGSSRSRVQIGFD